MTKFVLLGAKAEKTEGEGKSFVDEMVEGFDQPVRILVCLFARPEDSWQEVFEKDKFFFASKLNQKVLLTLADPACFVEQLKKTDVLYIRGGRTRKLIDTLEVCKGWEKELDGKTVAGSSAGVNFLGEKYYSLDDVKVCDGLGVLPFKALVHYRSDYNAPNIDWDRAYEELSATGSSAPVLTLAEGEFKVLERSL